MGAKKKKKKPKHTRKQATMSKNQQKRQLNQTYKDRKRWNCDHEYKMNVCLNHKRGYQKYDNKRVRL